MHCIAIHKISPKSVHKFRSCVHTNGRRRTQKSPRLRVMFIVAQASHATVTQSVTFVDALSRRLRSRTTQLMYARPVWLRMRQLRRRQQPMMATDTETIVQQSSDAPRRTISQARQRSAGLDVILNHFYSASPTDSRCYQSINHLFDSGTRPIKTHT